MVATLRGLPVQYAVLEHVDGSEGLTEHTGAVTWIERWVALYVAARAVPPHNMMLDPHPVSEAERNALRNFIACCVAGNVAESILLGGVASQTWTPRRRKARLGRHVVTIRSEPIGDRQHAEAAAMLLGIRPGVATHRCLEAHRRQVRGLLLAHWKIVKEVAKLLRRKQPAPGWAWRELRGAELRAVMRDALRTHRTITQRASSARGSRSASRST